MLFIESKSKKVIDIISIISSGESSQVEFKSTLRYNILSKRNDSNIELAVIKTVAGFLNAAGGTLIIGVDDSGKVLGLDSDQFKSMDNFQLHFWNLLRQSIGPEFADFLDANIFTIEDKSIFSVSCKPSNRAVFVKWKESGESKHQDLFFIRAGPQTESLGTRQALDYIKDHYNKNHY